MHILVNDQQITITSHAVKRFNSDGHLLLTVYIPKESKTADEMDALCDYIEENAPVIAVYDDNDEKVQSLEGFKLRPIFCRSKDGTAWELSIENSSELEYQYGLLRDRTASLEKTNAQQAQVIINQAEAIDSLNQQLLMVQLAAAELYEKSLAAEEPAEDVTEEPATESDEEPVETTEPEPAESEGE